MCVSTVCVPCMQYDCSMCCYSAVFGRSMPATSLLLSSKGSFDRTDTVEICDVVLITHLMVLFINRCTKPAVSATQRQHQQQTSIMDIPFDWVFTQMAAVHVVSVAVTLQLFACIDAALYGADNGSKLPAEQPGPTLMLNIAVLDLGCILAHRAVWGVYFSRLFYRFI